MAASAIALGIILALRGTQPATPAAATPDYTVVAVHVTRDPGLFVLPQIDQTLGDRDVAAMGEGETDVVGFLDAADTRVIGIDRDRSAIALAMGGQRRAWVRRAATSLLTR